MITDITCFTFNKKVGRNYYWEVIIVEKKRNLLNNTQADVSEREQICCVDNAPDNIDLSVPPPKFPKPPLKNETKI